MANSRQIRLISPVTGRSLEQSTEGLKNSTEFFPLRNGAYRLVQDSNYANSFGFQWNQFHETQIDRVESGITQSRDRFFAVTQWQDQDLSGQNVLEVGSGAGRFTKVVLNCTKATIYSVDYSEAVEANFRNNGHHDRLHLFQADIYKLPFAPGQFDKVFCIGVLQHTPDFKKSLASLVAMLKPGGELIVDFYPINGWYTKIHAKYLFRGLTRRMSAQRLLRLIEANIDWLTTAYYSFEKIGIGRLVNRFLPICDVKYTIPPGLSPRQEKEWIILDTFDMFSPRFDRPQRLSKVIAWVKELGMSDVYGDSIQYGVRNSVTFVRAIR